MDAKFFSSIKKYKKSNVISFESVPVDIKIDVFSVKKEHTFSEFLHMLRGQLLLFFFSNFQALFCHGT